ncbi:hypothetical protein [Actinomadura xylanilytica]|uniref:hypothetical protein n=1 Tax=Actinomadura xylanilytica TaxID=887459 RepID=UPI00255B05F2|nr:hypothetical protein [Actinomadura xylanilytica]MDL4772603.1 hypothetical protein [Actinomadura xylanilytica]
MAPSDEIEDSLRSLKHFVDALEAETSEIRSRTSPESESYSTFQIQGEYGEIKVDRFGSVREIHLDEKKMRSCSIGHLANRLMSSINDAEDSVRDTLKKDAQKIVDRF